MNNSPKMTDQIALERHRQRAIPAGRFLHDAVADELNDRLSMVNRSFNSAAVVTGHPDYWRDWHVQADLIADEETLKIEQESHDLVVHALALHWANDPVGQLVQMRRALVPDGLMLAAFFGGNTLSELRSCLGQAEAEVVGGLSPRVAPMGELRDLGGLLQRAGLALPVADTQTLSVEYDDMWHLMRDLRAMGETSVLSGRPKRFSRRAIFERAASLYREHFSTDAGRIRASFDIVYLTGWAPSADQPKALRPGSAGQRLAAALGTTETPLGD